MGVRPMGAHVVATLARKEKPVSSTNTLSAPWRRAFFDPAPITGEPGLHQCIVTFLRSDCGLLRAPPEGLQPAGQIMGMVVDATLHHNQCADPLQCPALRLKASLQRSWGEALPHVWPLRSGQPRGTARHRPASQAGGIISVRPEWLRPLTDRHPADAHTAGDLRLGSLAIRQQPGSLQATFFTLSPGELSWSPYHRRHCKSK